MAIYNLEAGLTIQTSAVFPGSTSGAVTLSAQPVAGTQSYTLPTGLPSGSNYVLTSDTSGNLTWVSNATGGGTVTSLSVVSANGLGGTVATATTTPAITLTTSVGAALTPLPLVGNGTTISGMFNTQSVSAATISGSSIVLRDTYISTSTPNTITITAPTTVASSITYTWPTSVPTNRNILSSDTSGNLSWISNVANPVGTVATNYTNYASINIGDVFVGMAPTVASFGQNYTVDASDVAFGDMLFHQKPLAVSSGSIAPAYFNGVAYDDTPVNGVVTPLYMASAGSTSASSPLSPPGMYTSKDGVNWTYVGSTGTNSTRAPGIIATVSGTSPSQVRTWSLYPYSSTAVYRSTNEGVSWTAGASLAVVGINNANGVKLIDGTIWISLTNASSTTNLYKTTNDGSTISSVTSNVASALGSILVGPGTGATRYIAAFGASTSYSVSTNGGTSFTTATCSATATNAVGIYDTAASKYVVASNPAGVTIQTSSTGLTGSWTTSAAVGATPVTPPAQFTFAYLNSAGSSTIGFYVGTGGGSTTTPEANFFVYSDDVGATIKYKQVATGQSPYGSPYSGQMAITTEIIFILAHSYNHLGFRKKYIYVDDNKGMSKAPLGTYQCLGKAGTQTGSYLWRRVS